VGSQLQAGSRYFDLRPAISGGKFVAGHYSRLGDAVNGTWQGGNGQSFDEMISQINDFTSRYRELVIVDLSHDVNTDVGNGSYRAFLQDEWDRLLNKLKNDLRYLYIAPDPTNIDVANLRLRDLIANQPAVLVIVRCNSSINIGKFNSSGFYRRDQFSVYDSYSNTPNPDQMSGDQYRKMSQQRTSPDSGYFVLSWTLTQDPALTVTSLAKVPGTSILDLAEKGNPNLYRTLLNNCSTDCFPNVLYIDGVDSSDIAALAMAVNNSTARA